MFVMDNFTGIAFGKAAVLINHELVADTSASSDPKGELAVFSGVVKAAHDQLERLYSKTQAELEEEEALIIDVQRMILFFGKTGAYFPFSTHNIQPNVRPENIIAMFETINGYRF